MAPSRWGAASVGYYRFLCRLLRIQVRVHGAPVAGVPALIVSNHVSWADIVVLGAIAPMVFVAKREVSGWPLIGAAARVQKVVFVDRERRQQTGSAVGEIAARLAEGHPVVLFAEGTSSDGNGVVPFKTPLFAAVKPTGGGAVGGDLCAQTLALTYTKLHGLPLCRRGRPVVAWYGDMDLASHAWRLLGLGPLDAHIRIGPPVPLDDFADRKALARYAEEKVRSDVAELLREGGRAKSNVSRSPA